MPDIEIQVINAGANGRVVNGTAEVVEHGPTTDASVFWIPETDANKVESEAAARPRMRSGTVESRMDGCFFETIPPKFQLNHLQDGRYPATGKPTGKYLLVVLRQGKNSVVQRFTLSESKKLGVVLRPGWKTANTDRDRLAMAVEPLSSGRLGAARAAARVRLFDRAEWIFMAGCDSHGNMGWEGLTRSIRNLRRATMTPQQLQAKYGGPLPTAGRRDLGDGDTITIFYLRPRKRVTLVPAHGPRNANQRVTDNHWLIIDDLAVDPSTALSVQGPLPPDPLVEISIMDVYRHLDRVGRTNPNSVYCVELVGHGAPQGPVMWNTWDLSGSTSDRYSDDLDPRPKDWHPHGFVATNCPDLVNAFAANGIILARGCNMTRKLIPAMHDVHRLWHANRPDEVFQVEKTDVNHVGPLRLSSTARLTLWGDFGLFFRDSYAKAAQNYLNSSGGSRGVFGAPPCTSGMNWTRNGYHIMQTMRLDSLLRMQFNGQAGQGAQEPCRCNVLRSHPDVAATLNHGDVHLANALRRAIPVFCVLNSAVAPLSRWSLFDGYVQHAEAARVLRQVTPPFNAHRWIMYIEEFDTELYFRVATGLAVYVVRTPVMSPFDVDVTDYTPPSGSSVPGAGVLFVVPRSDFSVTPVAAGRPRYTLHPSSTVDTGLVVENAGRTIALTRPIGQTAWTINMSAGNNGVLQTINPAAAPW